MLLLRGHHIFCLIGYRGIGYSQEYAENMTSIHQMLREHPNTNVQIVDGPDQLCAKYPSSCDYHCQDSDIYVQDYAILAKLGMQVGQVMTWQQIEEAIRRSLVVSDFQTICETCSWRSYGVCEEGMREMLAGGRLREVKKSVGMGRVE